MTTTYIQFTEGKVYDVANLKPFDLELAKGGYPIATNGGFSVRLLRNTGGNFWSFDVWSPTFKTWSFQREISDSDFSDKLFLAPLAVRNGRALHFGDEIVFDDDKKIIKAKLFHWREGQLDGGWKFADEVAQ